MPSDQPPRSLDSRTLRDDADGRHDEIIDGEPRKAFLVQLCLIAGLVLAMMVMALVNRLLV